MLESLLIGIVSGLVASILFWIGLYFFRPRMEAAEFAIMNGKIEIKVKNCTWFRPLIDVEAALFHVTQSPSPDNMYYENHDEILLKNQRIYHMQKADHNERNGAWIFESKEKADISLSHNDCLRLRISAADGWFNLRRVFSFDYTSKNIIIEPAQYESGRSMEIHYQ